MKIKHCLEVDGMCQPTPKDIVIKKGWFDLYDMWVLHFIVSMMVIMILTILFTVIAVIVSLVTIVAFILSFGKINIIKCIEKWMVRS